MKKVTLKIEGMSCSACSNGLEKYLKKQKDILNASVNLIMANAYIEYNDNISISDLEKYISNCGFKSAGIYTNEEDKIDNSKKYLIVFGFLLLIAVILMFSSLSIKNYIMILLVILFLIYGFDIIKSGISNLIHFMPNMDSLVTISIIFSLLYSLYNLFTNKLDSLYFESSMMVIFFVKLGRFIESSSYKKAKEAIKGLVQITPKTALLKVDNNYKEVTIDEVRKNDILICRPGDQIAVDGIIVNGESHLNESFITGESKPNKKVVDDSVIAGSINIDGMIEYKALKIGKDSTISSIVDLVVESISKKPNIQRISDELSSYFVPFIFIIAIISLIINMFVLKNENGFNSFVTILVVACPCAFGIGAPLAIGISEGVCAKKGIIIKSSEILERVNDIDTVVFDKTGIITYGNLRIFKVYNYSNYSENDLLKIVCSIENNSNHPISNTFKTYVKDNNVEIIQSTSFKEITGIGLKSTINNKDYYLGSNKLFTKLKINNKHMKDEEELLNELCSIIYVIEDKKVIGLIGVKDSIRENVNDVVLELKNNNKEVIILSGDNKKVADNIGRQIGVDNVISECLPIDKEKYIRKIKENNHKVMMIGDGINDAPSLITADIGLSITSASDIASSSSEVILMNDNLSRIIDLFTISKKTIRIIKENLFWAFFYNIIMIVIASGFILNVRMNPMYASIAMVLSSLSVCINSLRLRK